jgi:hypothetical protein
VEPGEGAAPSPPALAEPPGAALEPLLEPPLLCCAVPEPVRWSSLFPPPRPVALHAASASAEAAIRAVVLNICRPSLRAANRRP